MKKIAKIIASCMVVMAFISTAYAATAVPEKVIDATDSVVRILAKYSDGHATGTGFVIKNDKNGTLILTNYHVVEDNPHSISVWADDEELVNAEILAFTSQKDICVLKLSQKIPLKPVALSNNSPKLGEAVFAVGFPAAADSLSDTEAHTSEDATITDGIISALRKVTITQDGSAVKILQISAAINSGNSGGPLFNSNGKVIGVNTYGITDAQGIFGAIDVSEINVFLNEQGISVKPFLGYGVWIVLGVVLLLATLGMTIVKKRSIILKQSEYNITPFVPESKTVQNINVTNRPIVLPKRKFKIIVTVSLVALIVGYFASYAGAYCFARSGKFDVADKLLAVPSITELHDKKLPTYINAGVSMNSREYEKAKELFLSISGFMDSDTMVLETDYRYAIQLADANEFTSAIKKFEFLAGNSYKDSAQKVIETQYRSLLYMAYEKHDYYSAWTQLNTSKYDTMKNIADVRSELKELLYNEGIELYRAGELSAADKRFISGYKDSYNYKLLISVQRPFYGEPYNPVERDVKNLVDIFYFENCAEVLLSNDALAKKFLEGTWKSTSGGKYFEMGKDGELSHNLPRFSYGDSYKIENGKLLLEYSATMKLIMRLKRNESIGLSTPGEDETKTLFSFVAQSPNQIKMYCYQDGSTYILNRQ